MIKKWYYKKTLGPQHLTFEKEDSIKNCQGFVTYDGKFYKGSALFDSERACLIYGTHKLRREIKRMEKEADKNDLAIKLSEVSAEPKQENLPAEKSKTLKKKK